MSYNEVLLMGNLTRDPQSKTLPSGTVVTDFGLATNRHWTDQGGEKREEVCFVDVAAFGRTAENIQQYFQKGSLILIRGRLKLDQWEDKNGGGKRQKLSVVVDTFTFVPDGRRNDDRQQSNAPARNQSQPQRSYREQAQPPRSPQSSPPSNSQQLQARPQDSENFDPNENFDDIPF